MYRLNFWTFSYVGITLWGGAGQGGWLSQCSQNERGKSGGKLRSRCKVLTNNRLPCMRSLGSHLTTCCCCHQEENDLQREGVYIIDQRIARPKTTPIAFDKRYMLDNTNISVVYSDSYVSLEGDSYVMLFNHGYHQLVEALPGRLVKFFLELCFDVVKESGNLVKINVDFYAEKYEVDRASVYQYMHHLKKADLLRKVQGVSKMYALNPTVCWRRSLKERKAAIARWNGQEVPESTESTEDSQALLLADFPLETQQQPAQKGNAS